MRNKNKILLSAMLLLTLMYTASIMGVYSNATLAQSHDGKKILYVVLKEKIGFTDADIARAKKSGKNVFDLCKEKGVNEAKLKVMIYEEKCKELDNRVKSGNIAKENAEEIKIKFKENINAWDGSFKLKVDKYENKCRKPEKKGNENINENPNTQLNPPNNSNINNTPNTQLNPPNNSNTNNPPNTQLNPPNNSNINNPPNTQLNPPENNNINNSPNNTPNNNINNNNQRQDR